MRRGARRPPPRQPPAAVLQLTLTCAHCTHTYALAAPAGTPQTEQAPTSDARTTTAAAAAAPRSRIRDFQEDLRSKRSQQASDDMSGIGKFTIMAPQDRYNARTLVAPEFNMVRGAAGPAGMPLLGAPAFWAGQGCGATRAGADVQPCRRPLAAAVCAAQVGIVLFLSYLGAALFYFYVRWTSTLDIGWVWWVAPRT